MKTYNIYYKGGLVTSRPLPEKTINSIKEKGEFMKVDRQRSTKETIPVNRCRIVECINL